MCHWLPRNMLHEPIRCGTNTLYSDGLTYDECPSATCKNSRQDRLISAFRDFGPNEQFDSSRPSGRPQRSAGVKLPVAMPATYGFRIDIQNAGFHKLGQVVSSVRTTREQNGKQAPQTNPQATNTQSNKAPSTCRRSSLMCAGLVPQHPPMR